MKRLQKIVESIQYSDNSKVFQLKEDNSLDKVNQVKAIPKQFSMLRSQNIFDYIFCHNKIHMIHQPANYAQFYHDLKFTDKSFVEFYSPSEECCKQLDSFIQSKCKECGVHLIKANTEKVPSLRNKYNIEEIPTYLLVDREGKVLETRKGKGAQEETIRKLIEQCKCSK